MRPSEVPARPRDEVLEIISRYPVHNPGIFGSVARGEDMEESDMDILVDRIGPLSWSPELLRHFPAGGRNQVRARLRSGGFLQS